MIPVGVLQIDLKTKKIEFANPEISRIIGKGDQQVLMEKLSWYHCSGSKLTESERLDHSGAEKDRSCTQELKITKIRNQT